jgi:cell division protease FtsH
MSPSRDDRTPDPKQAPKLTPGPRRNLGSPPGARDWRFVWWYIPLMVLILWFWQDQLYQMTVKTIPYSQFKQYLADEEVGECQVQDLEIVGRIVPKKAQTAVPAATTEKSGGSKPATSDDKVVHPVRPGKSPAADADASQPAPASKAQVSKDKVATNKKGSGDQETPTADKAAKDGAAPFLFRTVRVEPDPQLVDQLEAAKVTFKGVRPSFISNFLYAWLLPIE